MNTAKNEINTLGFKIKKQTLSFQSRSFRKLDEKIKLAGLSAKLIKGKGDDFLIFADKKENIVYIYYPENLKNFSKNRKIEKIEDLSSSLYTKACLA